jgi:hypothetical protein
MPDRLRVGITVFGVSAALLATLLFGTVAVGAQPQGAKPTIGSCSVTGLRYSEKRGNVTYGVAVANLRAKMTSCPRARSLAATVAKDILRGAKIPARIAGLKVTAKEPCAGCTPDTQVSAKSGEELVTFTVKGGA